MNRPFKVPLKIPLKAVLLFSLLLCACAHDRTLIEKPFLYEISKGSNHAFILGTLRTGVSVEELPDNVIKAFDDADVYVMENKSGNFDISDRFSRQNATPLSTLLSADEYAAMKSWLDSAYYADQTKRMLEEDTPVGVAEKLAFSRMCERNYNQCRSMKYLQFVPLEHQLFRRRDAIDVAFLDTEASESQAHRCLAWSDAQTRENILASLTGADSLKGDVDKWAELEAAYRSGESERVASAAARYRTPSDYKCVISDRNSVFAGRVGEIMRRYRTPFITVSVGHLEGANSLRDELVSAGYRVERASYEKLRKAH